MRKLAMGLPVPPPPARRQLQLEADGPGAPSRPGPYAKVLSYNLLYGKLQVELLLCVVFN